MAKSKSKKGYQYITAIYWIVGFIIVIWLIEIINLSMDHYLCDYGIFPRTKFGLLGIFLSPFLHYGFEHVMMNTLPFIILAGFVIIHNPNQFLKVSIFIIIIGGFGVWLFGRTASHVGASGLIFGYFGFIISRSWYQRSFVTVIIALITILLYGGMLIGIVPLFSYISWEAHLFGFISGILAARILIEK
jgi:membrane associated rhomboid family serine protease